MNNEQFRRLLLEKEKTAGQKDGASPASASPQASGGRLTLGTKRTSFMPMTPRTVKGGAGLDFARQVAERNAAGGGGGHPAKKFKSSAAPKGTKLSSQYHDRTLERRDFEDDEKGARIKALEEQMKLGQLDQSTFEALRDQITGGDVAATHLVKGLDRKLLERIRQGEDVMGAGQKDAEEDIDEELDRLEEVEVARVEREKTEKKKGEMAAPTSIPGGKRSRDQILADLKAQRKAVADARAAARPDLGSHFRDISAKPKSGPRVERDSKGREVLITVDEHGNVKKKVRKVQPDEPANDAPTAPEKNVKFLDEGITLPTLKEQKKVIEKEESEEEEDIFADAGTEYNPLGDDGNDSDDDSSDEEGQVASKPAADENAEKPDTTKPSRSPSSTPSDAEPEPKGAMPPPPVPAPTSTKPETFVPRNYFKTASTEATTEAPPQNPFTDASFLAAVKKASALSNVSFSLGASEDGEESAEAKAAKEAKLKRRAEMLAANDRDFEDMDLGFGSSRFGDAEDAEEGGTKIKLSEWKGTGGADDDDGDDQKGGGGGEKKKRSRKRKGDKNSAKDVLGVLERRKESGKS